MRDSDSPSRSNRGHPTAEERRQHRQRLSRIRKAIQHGDYENDLKVSIAADRVLERLITDGVGLGRVVPEIP